MATPTQASSGSHPSGLLKGAGDLGESDTLLTKEQQQRLTRLAAQARIEGSTLSASDVIRYALTSGQEHLSEAELREAVIEHVHNEAKLDPSRAS